MNSPALAVFDGLTSAPFGQVDRITLGSTTAVALKGTELMEAVLKADVDSFGADRSQVLEAWAKNYGDMAWMVSGSRIAVLAWGVLSA